MRKREKFIVSSSLLALGLLAIQLIPLQFRILSTIVFFFLSYALTAWALSEDLVGVELLTIVPMPSFYAVAVSLFYFLLPSGFLSRLGILVLFGVGMYALYLTANIYSVAKIRTIQLLRAAHAVGLLFTLLTLFLLTNTIFSFHLPFWANAIGVLLSSFPLLCMFLWAIELKPVLEPQKVMIAVAGALILSETAIVLSFLPTTIWWVSLIITTFAYTMLGILHGKLIGRLFDTTIWEYVFGAGIVLVAFFILLPWK